MTSEKRSKGKNTRENILLESRRILNEMGVFLTLSELSKIIGITVGGITNYFPTKDHLFMGLAEIYERELSEFQATVSLVNNPSFHTLIQLFSGVMDIQYANRSTIRFISLASQSQKSLFEQVIITWNQRQGRHTIIVKALVDKGLLSEGILDDFSIQVFRFQFINTLSTWISSYTLYDYSKPFESVKPVYLAGILNVFEPFLTPQGKLEYTVILKQLKENQLGI